MSLVDLQPSPIAAGLVPAQAASSPSRDALRNAVLAREFEERGWLLVRGLFSEEEVLRWRELGIAADRDGYRGDLLGHPTLSSVVYDERILGIVEAILGPRPAYFCDSLFSIGWAPSQMRYHRDCVDRTDGNAPDWKGRYTILRFGIYLQDHSRHSGGLAVRERSHQHAGQRGRGRYVDSCVGDLVMWSHRTIHAGFVAQTRWDPEFLFPIGAVGRVVRRIGYRLPSRIFSPLAVAPEQRAALFCSFGVRDAHLERYLKYLSRRTFAIELRRNSRYRPEVLATAKRAGLDVLDLREEAERLDLASAESKHYAMPY